MLCCAATYFTRFARTPLPLLLHKLGKEKKWNNAAPGTHRGRAPQDDAHDSDLRLQQRPRGILLLLRKGGHRRPREEEPTQRRRHHGEEDRAGTAWQGARTGERAKPGRRHFRHAGCDLLGKAYLPNDPDISGGRWISAAGSAAAAADSCGGGGWIGASGVIFRVPTPQQHPIHGLHVSVCKEFS